METTSTVTPMPNLDFINNFTNGFGNEPQQGLISGEILTLFSKASIAALFFLSFFGICTNVLNVRTFIRMTPDDSVTILFLALSVTDFTVCNFSLGETVCSLVEIIGWDYSITWAITPHIPWLYLFAIHRIFSIVTIFITLFLAFQRCLCIIIPFHVKGMFSKRLTYIFLAAVFIFALVPYCFYMAQYTVVKYVDPTFNNMTRYRLGYQALRASVITFTSIGMGVVLNVAAQVVINTCLVFMWYGLKRSAQFRKTASQGHQSSATGSDSMTTNAANVKGGNRERQALVQVAIVSTIFVVTNSPYLLIALAVKLEPRIDLYGVYKNLYIIIFRLMSIIEIMNSCFNFFIYYKYNSKFRKLCFQSGKKVEIKS